MFCFDVKKRVLYSPFVYLFDQLRGSCDNEFTAGGRSEFFLDSGNDPRALPYSLL